ncbi:MAG TPA: serine/threonine-protein kinase [Phycisphaerales bacterium]|nr:serine/threonine-protein kinase [Phycisphaerales bacterium]
MSVDVGTRARELFERCASTRGGERLSLLSLARESDPEAAAEVESLLAFHDTAGSAILDQDLSRVAGALGPGGGALADAALPGAVGRYRVVREIGHGGMGVVYEAEQESPRRPVALKLVRPEYANESMLRRFAREAEALGMLHHPGVAQIFEAGKASVGGVPRMFIAMELVEGATLAQTVRDRRIPPRRAMELVAAVADAVDHAHRRGVVHRDLKPGNIIIEPSGRPKVLDFGVARLADPGRPGATIATGAGQIVGTLEYMAPEQLAGSPGAGDAACDVYSLGVIMYELLAGRRPIRLDGLNLFQAIDAVRTAEPARLGLIDPALRGDPEAICAKAMEKDPRARYTSAAALADDIRRSLRDEPVSAHAQTTWYQARKFARRHRALVGAVAGVIVALSAGIVAALWQAGIARGERVEAQRAADTSEAVTSYLVDFLATAHPEHTGGREVTIREALERAAGTVEERFTDQPAVMLRVKSVLGSAFAALGDSARSAEFYTQALALARELYPDDPARWADPAGQLASAYVQLDDAAKAESVARPVMEQVLARHGEEHEASATLMLRVGEALRRQERYDEARPLLTKAHDARVRLLGADHRETLVVLNQRALLATNSGESEEAERLLRINAEACVRNFGEDHPDTIAARSNLAVALDNLDRSPEAIRLNEQALASARRLYGDDHPDTLAVMGNLAVNLLSEKRFPEAIAMFEECLERRERVIGATHEGTLNIMNNLSLAYEQSGRLDDAARVLAELLPIMEGKEPESIRTMIVTGNCSRIARQRGELEDAVRWGARAAELAAKLPRDKALPWRMHLLYGQALGEAQRFDEAERELLACHEAFTGIDGAGTFAQQSAKSLASLYRKRGDGTKAAVWDSKSADAK